MGDLAWIAKTNASPSTTLTAAGRAMLAQAIPIWQRTQAKLDRLLGNVELSLLRRSTPVLTAGRRRERPTKPPQRR
jgi:hypothetical protein